MAEAPPAMADCLSELVEFCIVEGGTVMRYECGEKKEGAMGPSLYGVNWAGSLTPPRCKEAACENISLRH
jgi:hypothetical protein